MIIANGLIITCQPSQNCYELPLGQSSIMFRTAIVVSAIAKSAMSSAT